LKKAISLDLPCEIKNEINNITNYFVFMSLLFERIKIIFDTYFMELTEKIGKYKTYLFTFWMLFCYAKKKILKRKNDLKECCTLIIILLHILRLSLSLWIKNKNIITFDDTKLGGMIFKNSNRD